MAPAKKETKARGKPPERLELSEGDGMCMGFPGWLDGEFGKDPVVERAGVR